MAGDRFQNAQVIADSMSTCQTPECSSHSKIKVLVHGVLRTVGFWGGVGGGKKFLEKYSVGGGIFYIKFWLVFWFGGKIDIEIVTKLIVIEIK